MMGFFIVNFCLGIETELYIDVWHYTLSDEKITDFRRGQGVCPGPGLMWWKVSAPGARRGWGGSRGRGRAPGVSRGWRPPSWRPRLSRWRWTHWTWSWPGSRCRSDQRRSGPANAWRWPGPRRGSWCEYCQWHPIDFWHPLPEYGPRRAYPYNVTNRKDSAKNRTNLTFCNPPPLWCCCISVRASCCWRAHSCLWTTPCAPSPPGGACWTGRQGWGGPPRRAVPATPAQPVQWRLHRLCQWQTLAHLLDQVKVKVGVVGLDPLTEGHHSPHHGGCGVVHTVIGTVQGRSWRGLHLLKRRKLGYNLVSLSMFCVLPWPQTVAPPSPRKAAWRTGPCPRPGGRGLGCGAGCLWRTGGRHLSQNAQTRKSGWSRVASSEKDEQPYSRSILTKSQQTTHQVALLLVQPPGVRLWLELLLPQLGLYQSLLQLQHPASLDLLVTPIPALTRRTLWGHGMKS